MFAGKEMISETYLECSITEEVFKKGIHITFDAEGLWFRYVNAAWEILSKAFLYWLDANY